jgi:pimeloyl-ACP methyl ester carboxylesterase
MQPNNRDCLSVCLKVFLLLAFVGVASNTVRATEIELKDGRVLRGKLGKVSGLGDLPKSRNPDGSDAIQSIILLDDDLRRTFVSDRMVAQVRQEESRRVDEKFSIHQPPTHGAIAIKSVGNPLRVESFNQFGRRTFTMVTTNGTIDIIQGITELTPQWTKVQGITHMWDMRMATSSIPHDTLDAILLKQINPKNIEHYKKLARFYLECERYKQAREVLEGLPAKFPDQPNLKEDLSPSLRRIVQLSAQNRIEEIKLRSRAGQHELVRGTLRQFPTEGVGGEILQDVRDLAQDYETRDARCKEVVKQLRALAERLKDTIAKEKLKPILDEIEAEINLNTLDRMAAFLQSADDPKTPDSEKLAYAVSGWLLGANLSKEELPLAVSVYKVRGLIRKYLSETSVPARERFYSYIKQEPGGEISLVAALLANMKPPADPPEPVAGKPGYYEMEVTTLAKEPPITCYVQLPPEYDPYRRYPTIVALHGEMGDAEREINWWAGDWAGKQRTGQATRRGYIVIAPAWTEARQARYGYSHREHAAVLKSLRDAGRRFSIDTDRVYLTGHSIGGDAAWDIGLAHPDLWAGVIPIAAQADRYCMFYVDNAHCVPFYVVAGELDGVKMVANARANLDRWLRFGVDATVIEYRGRGHDDFYDEILRLFDWMGHFHRNFFPRSFACKTMRPWDNFFWWVEIEGLPPRSRVDPADWPPPNGAQAAQVKGKISGKNGLNVTTGSSGATVWISPEMLNFKERATVTVNGRRINGGNQLIKPDVHTLLEDVRTRGDRQHPFWARLECATGRVHGD